MKKLRLLPLLIALLAVLGFVLYLRAPQALSGLPKATPVSAPAPGASPAVTEGPEGMPAVTDGPEGMPAVTDEPEETPPRVAPVCLTELMPANKTTMPDADGDFSDWIELTNTGDTAQTLDGCWLSDEKKQPLKWQLPALTLQPGERMLVFCSGKDRREGELHTNFSLGSDGETLLLTAADGYEYWRVRYPECRSDESIFVEGEELRTGWLCSPGYPDDEQGHEDYLAASDHPGALVINEAVLYNDDFAGQDHQYYDWVELKNVSEEPVLLSDYCLSDDREDRLQFTLPARTLAPGGTFLVFCSGNTRLTNDYYCHAPFALSSKGDSLYLSYADGTLSDYVRVHDLPYLGSCGRMDGQPGFFYFKQRSPKADNVGGFRTVAERPTASPASGVYPGQETLTVELQGEGDIYYTTDGSVPTEKSTHYEGPLTLDKTSILRAVCVTEDKLVSNHATFSYFLHTEHTLPVVSLVTEPPAIFGGYGIYTNWSSDQKRDATVSFFEEGGSFTRDCAVKLHGASSREVWQKKNFKLIFKDRYEGELEYDLFHNGITRFHSIVLRGGDTVGMHILRDELASLTANKLCQEPLALDSRYCALYINGEYFGAYALREAYSEQYVADHLGGTEESVQILRAPVKQGEPMNIIRELVGRDMSKPENYEWACGVLDMESLCEWMALESYFNNRDPAGNLRYVSSDATGGRWRIAFFDLDIGMTSGYAGWEEMFQQGYQIGMIINSLRRSPAFVETLLETTARLYRDGLGPELVVQILDELAGQLEGEAERDCVRWRESYDMYLHNLSVQRGNFNETRTAYWLLSLKQYLALSDETMTQYFGEDYPKIS